RRRSPRSSWRAMKLHRAGDASTAARRGRQVGEKAILFGDRVVDDVVHFVGHFADCAIVAQDLGPFPRRTGKKFLLQDGPELLAVSGTDAGRRESRVVDQ